MYGETEHRGGSNAYGCPYCRTCAFASLCLNHSSLDWQYYQGAGNTAPLFYDMKGSARRSFPPDFINTGVVPDATSRSLFLAGVYAVGAASLWLWVYRLSMCVIWCAGLVPVHAPCIGP